MARTRPVVAVLIAAYNSQASIERAVRSALAEAQAVEVCVVDDASTDDTAAVAQACDDGSGRLIVLRQSTNQGPSAARNRAIAATRAPFLTVLDADDYFLPGRLAGLLAHAGEAELIADDLLRVAEDDAAPAALAWGVAAPTPLHLAAFVERNVPRKGAERGELGFMKPLMDRAFLDRHGLRYREEMRLGEDFELYARAMLAGARLLLVPAKGYVSVVRAQSLSGRHSRADLEAFRQASADLARVRALSPEEGAALSRHFANTHRKIEWLRLIEAVKAKSLSGMARPFLSRPAAGGYLIERLWEQFLQRAFGLSGRL